MAVMGFSHDPGALPFTTVRDAKWANRFEAVPPFIEIVGEHGCKLPRQMAKVLGVKPIEEWQARATGLHVPDIYKGKRLVAIWLAPAPREELEAAGIPEVSHAT